MKNKSIVYKVEKIACSIFPIKYDFIDNLLSEIILATCIIIDIPPNPK